MKHIAALLIASAIPVIAAAQGMPSSSMQHMNMKMPMSAAPSGDVNAGAKLVQNNGCEGCHGVALKGAMGPSLYGIEHHKSSEQIAAAIRDPRPPMPTFSFTNDQISDIVAYVSSLDGGAARSQPTVTFNPNPPGNEATVTVTFPGTPPNGVSVVPIMQMGSSTMKSGIVHLRQSSRNPHVYTGKVLFSMGGPWTVRVEYAGKTIDVPLTVKG